MKRNSATQRVIKMTDLVKWEVVLGWLLSLLGVDKRRGQEGLVAMVTGRLGLLATTWRCISSCKNKT